MISKNFTREEFACKCGCDQDTVDVELVEVLQKLRDYYMEPITITSGNRCPEHNAAIGGAPRSKHLISKAADIQVDDKEPTEIYDILVEWYPDKYGIGLYTDWVHIDVRADKARWDKR